MWELGNEDRKEKLEKAPQLVNKSFLEMLMLSNCFDRIR